MNFLYLSEEDMIKAGVKDMPRCIDAMEETFKLLHRGDYRLGGPKNCDHGLRTMFPKESDIPNMPIAAPGRWFTAMPAYLGGKYHVFGIKTYGANQENYKKNLPRSILMMSLMDVETGAPLAYMSANILSAMRTGGVTGLFARKFAPENAKKVAVIGPGVIGRYSLDAVMVACPTIRELSVLGRGEKNKAAFRKHCEDAGYRFDSYTECDCAADAYRDADIVITASSQAQKFCDYPLLPAESIKRGACVIVTSAARVERALLDDADMDCVLVADDVRSYADNRGIDALPETDEDRKSVTVKGAIHERLAAGAAVVDLPDIADDPNWKREAGKTYLCASGGNPLEDVAWACSCYERALDLSVGTSLELWKESEL